jgi:DNA-binding LacI/PurR family transcriptional regulator
MPKNGPPPKYQHVFDELHREILSGRYRAGQKLPSEADLVKRFGVSRITVGRAVRDLRQMGLVERRAGSGTYARALKSASLSGLSFGLLIPELGRTEIFEPICQGMAESPQAGEHALLWGKSTASETLSVRQEQALQNCRQYIDRQVAGVFFAPSEPFGPGDHTNQRIVSAFDKARIPVVLLDRDFLLYPRRSPHDLVGIDNRRTGFLATAHLLELGCRRIAFLAYPRTAATIDERIAGYREALFMNGVAVEQSMVQRLPSEEDEISRRVLETLRPDGIVCANDRTAGKIMQIVMQLGLGIPGDVRIVGIDDIAYASLLPVPLTTMRQPCREIGMAAMSVMLERIARPGMAVRDVLLETTLVVRESCGANLRSD